MQVRASCVAGELLGKHTRHELGSTTRAPQYTTQPAKQAASSTRVVCYAAGEAGHVAYRAGRHGQRRAAHHSGPQQALAGLRCINTTALHCACELCAEGKREWMRQE